MHRNLTDNNVAVFTSLERIAQEVVFGSGVSQPDLVDFFELIATHVWDSVFIDLVLNSFNEL